MSHEATFWEQLIGAAPNLNASSAPFASSHECSSRHHQWNVRLHFPCFHSAKARALALEQYTRDRKSEMLTKVSYLLNNPVEFVTALTTP